MSKGFVSLVLHSHLPFVKHPEYQDFLEEDWFFEAAVETYLPILDMMERLNTEGHKFRMNMVVSPSLAAMMEDRHHQERLRRYMQKAMELGGKEAARLRDDPDFGPVSRFYQDRLAHLYDKFVNVYNSNLIGAFRNVMESGSLELMTCSATHGLLPLLRMHPESVRAQVKIGASEFERHFGRRPKGIWLPECGYYEGVEDFLADEDIRYFLVDTHCLNYAAPKPVYGVYAPMFTKSGVAAFGRDIESSKQVWSAKEGYPGDASYREFYRDVGYDRPFEEVKEYVQPTGLRKQTGLKYHKITGDVDLSQKLAYSRPDALRRADEHAANFMFNRERQVEHLAGVLGRPPIVVAPYDAELFGHWWFEGPDFLEALFKKAAWDQKTFEFVSLGQYLEMLPVQQSGTPATGSWGDKGYFEVWVNPANDYIPRHLFACADQMIALARDYRNPTELETRALNQCARELLLAQSSDWPFIITMGTMTQYAHRRVREHVLRFQKLAEQIRSGRIDESWLGGLMWRDSIFPVIDYRVYRTQGQAGGLL
jgi:1,4-alpha-glucan branching enzyme